MVSSRPTAGTDWWSGTVNPTPREGATMSGHSDDLKGRAKEAVGDLTGDKDLQHEGKADQAAGKAKDKLDDAKDWVDDKIDQARDNTHK